MQQNDKGAEDGRAERSHCGDRPAAGGRGRGGAAVREELSESGVARRRKRQRKNPSEIPTGSFYVPTYGWGSPLFSVPTHGSGYPTSSIELSLDYAARALRAKATAETRNISSLSCAGVAACKATIAETKDDYKGGICKKTPSVCGFAAATSLEEGGRKEERLRPPPPSEREARKKRGGVSRTNRCACRYG